MVIYEITNGSNGTNAAVWSIGEDGYWYKDDVKQAYKAVGEKGGDGCYYKPNETTGNFDIYNADGTLKESTNIS